MEGCMRNKEGCLQFIDFMEKERDSVAERVEEEISHSPTLEQKLELRLGPPGGDWSIKNITKTSKETNVYSNGFFSKSSCSQIPSVLTPPCPERRSFHLESANSSQACSGRVNPEIQNPEKKLLQPSHTGVPTCSNSQKSGGMATNSIFPSKNGTGSSSKLATQSTDEAQTERSKSLFVKINMDGVLIGRKIDINAYDNYEKLSIAIDELFRDLPAQCNSCDNGDKGDRDGRNTISSILNERREYALVYEDNEGDRMLVGDLPWPMFVSTVKRLRVLKTTELSKLQNECKLP